MKTNSNLQIISRKHDRTLSCYPMTSRKWCHACV